MIKPTLSLVLPAALLAMMYCKPAKKSTATETTPPVAVAAAPTTAVKPEGELQMEIANTRWPGTKAEDLKEGHTIYTTKCNACHKTFEISRFNEYKWLHEIDDMSPKARLSAEEKLKLTKYILSYRETKEKMRGN
jgi:hypothetical protein